MSEIDPAYRALTHDLDTANPTVSKLDPITLAAAVQRGYVTPQINQRTGQTEWICTVPFCALANGEIEPL